MFLSTIPKMKLDRFGFVSHKEWAIRAVLFSFVVDTLLARPTYFNFESLSFSLSSDTGAKFLHYQS